MARIVWDDEVDELDLGDGDFISIKARMSAGDETEIDKRAFKASRGMDDDQEGMVLSLDPATYNQAILEVMVKGWRGPSFTQRDGTPLPFTPENTRLLDKETAKLVREAIDTRNSKRSADDTKGSTGKSSKR